MGAGEEPESRHGDRPAEEGVHTHGEEATQDGHDGGRGCAHGEEPGVPSTGHGGARSRRLPQEGGDRHLVVIGSPGVVLQPS
jgi:hypothetical protein